jgi:hypothetical protein
MKQFSKEQLENLKVEISSFQDLLNESNNWSKKCLKYEDFDRTDEKIKNARRLIRKVRNSIDSKPVFALFGASQVGKSYLIKNILSIDGKPLMIESGTSQFDFLKEINPQGGSESTGVVTRFSIERTYLDENYPIEVKLLNVKDLVIIFCDSYFSDMKKLIDYPGKDAFQVHADYLLKTYQTKTEIYNVMIEEDILDMREYFDKNFSKFYGYVEQINQSSFWSALGTIIHKVPYSELADLFSILWQKEDNISKLLKELIKTSELLGFRTKVFAPFDAVLREKGRILDVSRLHGVLNSTDKISIQCEDKSLINVGIASLCALTAELKLIVPEELKVNKPFLEQTDMLDFPGARSRLELLRENLTESDNVSQMLLRGKIAYLFNKYSADFEVNNLLFCCNDKQHEINYLPTLLNDWIGNNIGKDSSERQKSLSNIETSPLFLIFTFLNRQLDFDSTNIKESDYYGRWETRFVKLFEKEIITPNFSWHKEWTDSKKEFQNFFLLRDYKYSKDIYDGYETNEIETSMRPERVEHFNRLETSFINHEFVKNHFPNPKDSWNAAATINNDGSKRIIDHLAPAASNFVKIKNNVNIVQQQKEIIFKELSRYFQTDNLQEKRKSALKKGTIIQFDFSRVFGKDPSNFSLFLKKLSISETEVYSYFHSNLLDSSRVENFSEFSLLKDQFPEINPENSKEENLEIMKQKLHFETAQEVEEFLTERGIDYNQVFSNQVKTTATRLLNGLFELWLVRFDFKFFTEFEAQGLTRKAFEDLRESMLSTIESMGLKEQLLSIIQNKTRNVQFGRSTEEYLSAVSTSFINDFVTNFGFSLVSSEKVSELELISEEYGFNVHGALKPDNTQVTDEVLVEIFDGLSTSGANFLEDMRPMIDNYGNYVTKVKLALLANCGFVNYNIEDNAKLGELITKVDSLNFNLV